MGPVSRYAPPLAVMALIFALSATPDLSSGLGTWDLVLRKIAHLTIYAVSDEIHQSFVEGRHGSPVDVAIDATGIGLAALVYALVARRRGRPGPPWPLTASRAP